MERLVTWITVGGMAGFVLGYVFRAQQQLQPHQSRLRWIPALLVGGDVGGLLRLLAWLALFTGLGAVVGWLGWLGLDALTAA